MLHEFWIDFGTWLGQLQEFVMVAEVSRAALDRERVALFLRGETTQRKPIGQLVLFRLAAGYYLVRGRIARGRMCVWGWSFGFFGIAVRSYEAVRVCLWVVNAWAWGKRKREKKGEMRNFVRSLDYWFLSAKWFYYGFCKENFPINETNDDGDGFGGTIGRCSVVARGLTSWEENGVNTQKIGVYF